MHQRVHHGFAQWRHRDLFAFLLLEPDDLVTGPEVQPQERLDLADDVKQWSVQILAIHEIIPDVVTGQRVGRSCTIDRRVGLERSGTSCKVRSSTSSPSTYALTAGKASKARTR